MFDTTSRKVLPVWWNCDPRWRREMHGKLDWALATRPPMIQSRAFASLAALVNAAEQEPGAACIVQWLHTSPQSQCQGLTRLVRAPATVFVVGNPEILQFRQIFAQLGVIDTVTSIFELDRVGRALERCVAAQPVVTKSLKDDWWERLPWGDV